MKHLVALIGLLSFWIAPANAQILLTPPDLELLLEEFVGEDEPSVVLYVASGDESWVGVRGLSNLEAATAANVDDLYRIGSVTKPMTATLILQLVEEGLLDLDGVISDYTPAELAVERIANADTATIRQMLQMTSGIFSYTDSDEFYDAVLDNPQTSWTALDTLTFIYDEAPDFAPGEDYVYSNSNYNIAELIIEAQTGDSLAVAMQKHIFEPLGMDRCYVETPDVFAERIVRGYELFDEGFVDVTAINDGVGLGDGGVVCPAEDLAKFPRGLWEEELLGIDLLEEMLDTVPDDGGGQYGLGIAYEENEFGYDQLSHDGATSGFQSNMVYLPEEDLTIVILTNNFDSELVEELTLEVQALLLDQ